jgi:histidinol dehydrogenase
MSLIPILTEQDAFGWLEAQDSVKASEVSSQKSSVQQTVADIFNAIRAEGLVAIRRYGQQFGELQPNQALELSPQEIQDALARVPQDTLNTLADAARNIRAVADAVVDRVKDPIML